MPSSITLLDQNPSLVTPPPSGRATLVVNQSGLLTVVSPTGGISTLVSTISSEGTGVAVYDAINSTTSTTYIKSLAAGSNISITDNGSGTITIASTGGGGGGGTVTSVGLTVPGFMSVSGSPITASGTLAVSLNTQSANAFFAGPTSGSAAAPTFRAIGVSDIPGLPWSQITSGLPTTLAGYGITDGVSTGGSYNTPTWLATISAAIITSGTLGAARLPLGLGAATPTSGQILVGNAGGTAYAAVSMSGDATLSSAGAITLATTGVSASSYGSATQVAQITVDAKGRITAASNVTISGVAPGGTAGGILSGTYPNPGFASLTANAVLLGNGTGALGTATIGTGGRILTDQGASTNPAFVVVSGDGAFSSAGVLTVTKTNGVAFVASATTDTTNATNISSGTIGAARLPLGLGAATPSAGQILVGNAGGTAYAAVAMSGDATLASTGAITVTKTSGVAFVASATTDTTNAGNISAGTLLAARMPALTGDVTTSAGTVATTVVKINGTLLSGLATGILKNTTGTGVPSIAVSGTDYAPATSGTSILKGNGSGGFSNAVSGTDYAPATSGSALLKGNGSGGFATATAADLTGTIPGTVQAAKVQTALTTNTTVSTVSTPDDTYPVNGSGGNITVTLAVSTTFTNGQVIRIYKQDQTTSIITVAINSADTFSTEVPSINITTTGDMVSLMAFPGSNQWVVIK